jgi:replicative DNA helicase
MDIFDAVHFLEKKPRLGVEWVQDTLRYLADKYEVEMQEQELTEDQLYRLDVYRAYRAAAQLLRVVGVKEGSTLHGYLKTRQWVPEALAAQDVGTVTSYGDFREALRDQGFITPFLDEIGLDKKDVFHPDCLLFTWRDEKGNVIGFTCRDMKYEEKVAAAEASGEKYKEGKYKNIRTTGLKVNVFEKKRRLYGIDKARDAEGPLYIFEGQADVITARLNGLPNCVAIAGSTLRDEHIQLLKKLDIYDIIICLDGDETGRQKLGETAERLAGNKDLRVRLIEMPEDSDPDSYITQYGMEGFKGLACWTAFEWRLRQYDEEDDESDICRAMIPYIVNEPSPVVRDQLCKKLAKRTGISMHAITAELNILLDAKAHYRSRERQELIDQTIYQLRSQPEETEVILQKASGLLRELAKKHDIDSLSHEDFVRAIDQQKLDEEKTAIGDGGFKLGGDLRELEEIFRGSWDEGVFICIGGKPNVGKTAFLCKFGHSIATHNEDVVVIYHTIDDTAEQLVPRFVTVAEGSRRLSINMVRQPNYWTEHVGLAGVGERREEGYKLLRELALQSRLVIKDLNHGSTLPFIENLICYYQDKYPDRKIVYVLDNFHKLRDYDGKDERVRFKALSEAMKAMAIRRRCCVVTSVEYTKLPSGMKPTNHNIGECLTGDTQVFNVQTGDYIRIDQVKPNMYVATLNEQQKIVPRAVEALLDKGVRPVYRVVTKSGRSLKTTINHPFYSEQGWVKLSDLDPGAWIAIPRELDWFRQDGGLRPDCARLLGYLAGDGSYSVRKDGTNETPSFTNKCKAYIQDVENIVRDRFGIHARHKLHNDSMHLMLRRTKGGKQENRLVTWLKELGIHGQIKEHKTVPDELFRSGREARAHYLAGLFMTDGSIVADSPRVHFSNKSVHLARGCQRLLLHLGIQSSMHGPDQTGIYRVTVNSDQLGKFSAVIPIKGYKGDLLERARACQGNKLTYTGDVLPPSFTQLAKESRRQDCKPVRYSDGYWIQKETVNRRRAQWLCNETISSHAKMQTWAYSDIFWDRIESIEYVGEEQVWDLTVEDTHNFVANDIFCHNTGQVEYDASAIIHLYSEVTDCPDSFTVCHEDVDWQGGKIYLPRVQFIVGKNKISEVRKSFFLDFWPASSDYRHINQKVVLKEAKEMKETQKNISPQFSHAMDELNEVY